MSVWNTNLDEAPRKGEIILLVGETVPDHDDIRAGSFISQEDAAELGYRECMERGGWLIWSDGGDDYHIIAYDGAVGWLPKPDTTFRELTKDTTP